MPEFPVLPPHEAGARIRIIATKLVEAIGTTPSTSGTFISTTSVGMAYEAMKKAELALKVAIEKRRVTQMRDAFQAYSNAVTTIRIVMTDEATRQIRMKPTSYPLLSDGRTMQKALTELRELANNLPTQPDLPSADSRDTALRGIIAILRTHEVPGAEKLTHQAKEDQSGKTEVTVDKETLTGIIFGKSASTG